MKIKTKKEGFTLVELLVVISILALLLIIAVPNIMKMSDRMKDRGLVSKIESIEDAAITYAQNNSNKLKQEWGKGAKCDDAHKNENWCEFTQTTPSDSGYSRSFYKYVHKMTVEQLIEKGALSSERTDGDSSECDITDPTDANRCLDCAVVTIKLDDDYKTATAHLEIDSYKTWTNYPKSSCPNPSPITNLYTVTSKGTADDYENSASGTSACYYIKNYVGKTFTYSGHNNCQITNAFCTNTNSTTFECSTSLSWKIQTGTGTQNGYWVGDKWGARCSANIVCTD